MAVVGAGHLEGMQRWLRAGGVSEERLRDISSSSRQAPTWPGRGVLQVVRANPADPSLDTVVDAADVASPAASSPSSYKNV